MHSSRMRTARSSSRLLGGSASVHAGIHTPPPPEGLDLDPQDVGLDTPLARPPNLPFGPGPRHPPVIRMTDRQVYKYNLRKLRLRAVKI